MLMQRLDHTDAGFATLDRALDPLAAGKALADALDRAGFPTSELTASVERVRLKPGRKALIGYRLRGTDALGHPLDQQLMFTLWPQGDPERLPDMGVHASATPAFGPPRMPVAELAGEAWFFPNDRKIAAIADLFEQARGIGEHVEVVHYVPEQGCTLRVNGSRGTFYGKVRADDRGVTATRVACLAGGRSQGQVRLAQVVHCDVARRIQWQQAVAGQPLEARDVLEQPALWAGRIATALGAFHALPAPSGLPVIAPELLAQAVVRRIGRIAGEMPGHAARLSALATRLEEQAQFTTVPALSHGDLHPANLLWDGASFALIDLDTCALAPPARDFASLAAALAVKAIGLGISPKPMIDALADASGVSARQFHWFLAASLIGERLYRSATRRKHTDREAVMALAEASLEFCETHHG